MTNTVIQVENLSKQYRLGIVGTNTIRDDVSRLWCLYLGKEDPTLKIGQTNVLTNNSEIRSEKSDYIWALKDINFSVQQGEVLGIIGKNGAGKSTLLKILSKVTAPTTGSVKVKGRIASLLEVGTGFHGELSGRENIFLNGAILGMTKAEIRGKLDEIIDFSGVETYIDTPVKRYSSGMYVRLAFAVAAHLDPEILIVDEVLAVGDAEFQKKAIGKMQEVSSGQGRTVLFVSHNMASIKQLCSQGMLLANGKILTNGPVGEIISEYLITDTKENAEWIRKNESNSEIFFNSIKIYNSKKILTYSIATEEDFEIHISLTSLERVNGATVSIRFENMEGVPIFTTSLNDTYHLKDYIDKGNFELIAHISKNILVTGKYKLIIACFISRIRLFDYVDKLAISIEDLYINNKDKDRLGFVIPDYKWEFNRF